MYGLCDQTVTVYRLAEGTVQRQVLAGCYLQMLEKRLPLDRRPQREFLLVVPGEPRVFPGDRVVPGEGPLVTVQGWKDFLPAQVPGLVVVGKTTGFYRTGIACHTEATN